ncbi:MAG: hypothetical protein HDT15_06155 [Oscillibacter sp.]|nr:hypothetical protein [Oscillibacter sp.]
MECRDYEKILNAMLETGVYVVREEDRGILYYNRRAQEATPEVRLGIPCYEVWSGSCGCCPLLTIGDQSENRTVNYNDSYGGVVDITATRTMWEGETPAFVITVAPRMDSGGYTYRKILHVDLERDRCDVLKSDPEGWQPQEGSLSGQLQQFAVSGIVHPEDADRVAAFARQEHLRSAPNTGQEALTLLYRRRDGESWRWNLMEIIPDRTSGGAQSAILCVKDVHDAMREGLEREEINVRSQELIRSLGEQNFSIYTINLSTGGADPVRVDGEMRSGMAPMESPWDELMRTHILDRLHEAYRDEFRRRFSLEGLRRTGEEDLRKTELLCQWRSGEDYRYISITAHFGPKRENGSYIVLALQDVDDRMRRELAHTKRDMQMAAILQSRYQMMTTVYLDSGLCERMDLTRPAGPENTLTGDYNQYIQRALAGHVHPEDAELFRSILNLDHLRETAESIKDHGEEVCQYRMRTEEERWVEMHVLYSRQEDQVMVNLLGQDVTAEKREETARIKSLEDQAYMITSLSSMFFSTYYIDLERDTFRAVTQQRRVGDLLGDEVNCTAALELYANYFVHPEDREKYLSVMNMSNLRETLRWWKPYVTVDYRKALESGGPDSWVRATAIMARSGSDDIPRTVVYVARDITADQLEAENGNIY